VLRFCVFFVDLVICVVMSGFLMKIDDLSLKDYEPCPFGIKRTLANDVFKEILGLKNKNLVVNLFWNLTSVGVRIIFVGRGQEKVKKSVFYFDSNADFDKFINHIRLCYSDEGLMAMMI